MCVCVCDNKKSRAHSPRPLPPPPNYMYIYYVRPKRGRARTHTKIPFPFRPIPSLSAAPLPVTRHHARPVRRSVHPSVKLIVQYFPGFFSPSSTIPLRPPPHPISQEFYIFSRQTDLLTLCTYNIKYIRFERCRLLARVYKCVRACCR